MSYNKDMVEFEVKLMIILSVIAIVAIIMVTYCVANKTKVDGMSAEESVVAAEIVGKK